MNLMKIFQAKNEVFALMLDYNTDKTHVFHECDMEKSIMVFDSACNAISPEGKYIGKLHLHYDENNRMYWSYSTTLNGIEVNQEVRGSQEPYQCEADLAKLLIESGIVKFDVEPA